MKVMAFLTMSVLLIMVTVVACGGGKEAPTPPTVTTSDATNIIATEAKLNGNLSDLGTASSVNVSFVWGTTSGGPYPNETTPQAMSAPGAFSFDLTDLTPGTTYSLQAKAVGDGTSYGTENIFITAVNFPDANLETAIREAINNPEGLLYPYDLKYLTELEASERDISNLAGLEYCVNLQELHLNDNNISDLSPLSGLTNLHGLWLWGNNINDISPLSGLTNLESLFLANNNISDISPLAALTTLNWLDLVSNNISDISPLSGLTNLDWLPLGGNNISDISPLVANSGLSEEDFVSLEGNPLDTTSINVYIPQLRERGVDVQL